MKKARGTGVTPVPVGSFHFGLLYLYSTAEKKPARKKQRFFPGGHISLIARPVNSSTRKGNFFFLIPSLGGEP
jgi:hypothetical protein